MYFVRSYFFMNETLGSWTFLGHFCHHVWVGATAKQHQPHPKVMTKMVKNCSTDQSFIRKRNTTYKICSDFLVRYLITTVKSDNCVILRFLWRQRCGRVWGEGSDSPALLTAMMRNWYHFPSLNPGTRASNSSMVAVQLSSSVISASNQPPNLSFFWMI